MNQQDIRERFQKWLKAETTFALGIPDNRSIADWWLAEMESVLEEKRRDLEGLSPKDTAPAEGVTDYYTGFITAKQQALSLLSTPISNKK